MLLPSRVSSKEGGKYSREERERERVYRRGRTRAFSRISRGALGERQFGKLEVWLREDFEREREREREREAGGVFWRLV